MVSAMLKTRRQKQIHLALCVLLLIPAGCGKGNRDMQRPPIPVTAATVDRRSVPIYEEAIGSSTASESVNVVPQVSGKIIEIHFAQGANVKKGDMLFTIDPRPYKAALDDAQAKLAKDQAELSLSEETLKRWSALKSSNYVSPQELDALRAKVRSAQASVEGSRAAIETAKINLDYCSIRSPINGVVGKYLVDMGNVVSSMSSQPLVSIQNVDILYIDFTLPEKSFLKVKTAMEKSGRLDTKVISLTDENIAGIAQLRYIDNKILPGSGTLALRAVLDNQERRFWPGQSVKVKLIFDQIADALLIPFQALQFGQQGPFVFTVKPDQTAEMKVVEPGQRQGDQIVIQKGLEPGEQVVTTGHLMLSPGAKVIPMPPGGMSPDQMKQAAAAGK